MLSDDSIFPIDDDTDEPVERGIGTLFPRAILPSYALAEALLEHAFTTAEWSALHRRDALVIVVEASSTDWAEAVTEVFRRRLTGAWIEEAFDAKTSRAIKDGVRHNRQEAFGTGQSLVIITDDPRLQVSEDVRVAADRIVRLPPMDAGIMRQAIRKTTGRTTRGLRDEDVSGLGFADLAYAMRPQAMPAEIVSRLRRARSRRSEVRPELEHVPALATLPLTEPVRQWADETLNRIGAVSAGSAEPRSLSFSVLGGPPGTGKTLVAHALARASGWSFRKTNVAEWFSSSDGHLGGVSKTAKQFFDDLLANAPAVGLIDELQSLPDRSALDADDRPWWTALVDSVLTQIDRIRESGKPIYLIGACNHADRLDAALVRPGRFTQRIDVMPPTLAPDEALALLRFYVGDGILPDQLDRPARLAVGLTPAAVESIVNGARARARSEGRSLSVADLVDTIAPPDKRSDEDRRRVAIHEAGHAIAALALGRPLKSVSIIPDGTYGGTTEVINKASPPTLADIEDLVVIALAGRAADELLGRGANAGARDDLRTATELLLGARTQFGLAGSLAWRDPTGVFGASVLDLATRQAIEADLARLFARAKALVEGSADLVTRLADRLMHERMMLADEIENVVVTALKSEPSMSREKTIRSATTPDPA